jgi:HK97 family phage portal protein
MPVLINGYRRLRTRTSGSNPAREPSGSRWAPTYWWNADLNREFTVSQARSITAVNRSVQLIAGAIAGFPLHVYSDSGGIQRQVSDPSLDFLTSRPNPEVPPVVFWRTILSHKVLHENAFLWVEKDNGNRPIALWPIQPNRVAVGRRQNGEKVYEVDNYLPMLDYTAGGEIVHILGDSDDGLLGVGPLSRYNNAMQLTLDAEAYATRMFNQDSTPRGVLTTEQTLTPQQAEDLADRWEQRHAGLANAHRVAVVSHGAKFDPISFTPEQSQMLDSRRFQISEVGRMFGIPPHLLGDVERSTSWGSGIESQSDEFRVFTLSAHMQPVEQTLTLAFLADTDRYIRYNPDAVLRAKTIERYEAHKSALEAKWKTADEVRALENMPPLTPAQREELHPAPPPMAAAPGGQPGKPPGKPADDDEDAA